MNKHCIAFKLLIILGLVVVIAGAAVARDFYQGETVRFIVGFSAGGGPDIRSRLVARHWPNHIPGRPRMIVQNRPGAAGRMGTSMLFNVVKPDGLTVANVVRDNIIMQLADQPGVKYEIQKFQWVGSLQSEGNVVFIRSSLPYHSLDELKKAKKPIVFAARSVGATNFLAGKGLEALGVPLRMIIGYGTSKVNIAFEQGEIEASALGWTSLSKGRPHWIAPGGLARLIVEFGTEPTPGLDIPFGPKLKAVAGMEGVYQTLNKALGLPQGNIAAPPDTPKDRMKTLRDSYQKMLRDPKFLADAEKLNIKVNALLGDDLLRVFEDFLGPPPSIRTQFKELLR